MISPAPGILLIAEPFLKDPSFMRSVVLLCRHEEEEGSFGFVLNNLYHQKLDELIPALAGFDLPVFKGGPVQMDTLHYIHQYPELLPESLKLTEGIYWGGDFEILKTLMLDGLIDPGKIRFFLGYSGWGEGQLADEMQEKSWLTVSANRAIVFDTAQEDIWKLSLIQLGGQYERMIHYPTDPQLN
ncbi:MAG TPA: YqgE/AlgH family protein [Ferruginibacter sp.]|nr:YqgE/AlgH family protein [Ferruginibacter sp.]